MPLVIMMRHGQADNNVNRVLVGRHIESHLTEYGKKQVVDTAKNLKNIPVNKILVSPVIRCVETAKIVCQTLGMDYTIDERLYEVELGKLVGMNYEDIIKKHGNVFVKFYTDSDPYLSGLGVEPFVAVKKRVQSVLDEVLEKYENDNVLLVTHLDPIKAAIDIMLGLKPDPLYRWHIRNASLTILKHESKVYSLSGVNVMGAHRYVNE